MSELLFGFLVFAVLITASFGCLFTYERLPARLREDDTVTIVRLIITFFVVMTSLALGLMVSAAKNRVETIDRTAHTFATNLILLDRILLQYGQETDDARQRLRAYVQHFANSKWASGDPAVKADQVGEKMLNEVGNSLRAMTLPDAEHAALGNDARQQFRKIIELRWDLVTQSGGSIPTPLLAMVIGWLLLIFASFGYRAPKNFVIMTLLIVSAALIAATLGLIVDMDEPFSGPIQVSPTPLRRALVEIGR